MMYAVYILILATLAFISAKVGTKLYASILEDEMKEDNNG